MVKFALLNELSLLFNNTEEADSSFLEFFTIARELKSRGIDKIRVDRDLKSFEIVSNVYFQQYLGQMKNRELRDRLRAFLANQIISIDSPLIKEDEEESNELFAYEYYYSGVVTQGALACAFIWNSLVISFNSSIEWDRDYIEITREDIGGNLESFSVRNILHENHLVSHNDFFEELKQFIIADITPQNFWEKRDELFQSKIVLCDEIKSEVKNMDSHIFVQALSILLDLDNSKRLLSDYTISRESETVSNDPNLRRLREFNIDGKKEFFQKHIKNLSNGYRIHYFEKNGKIYIGYIGKHLPTKNF